MTIRGSGVLLLACLGIRAVACGSSSTAEPEDAGTDALASDTGASDSKTDSGAPSWTQTAFDGANIVPTLAIDPKNPKIVFIGISAGSAEQGFFGRKTAARAGPSSEAAYRISTPASWRSTRKAGRCSRTRASKVSGAAPTGVTAGRESCPTLAA